MHDQASVGGHPRALAPSVICIDVHLEVGLDILPREPRHLSGVLPQGFRTLAQSDMHGLNIRLHSSLLANCIPTLPAARRLSLAAIDLYLYAFSWSNSAASHIRPVRTLESQLLDVLDSSIDPLHDLIQNCDGLHVMEVWPENSPHSGFCTCSGGLLPRTGAPTRCLRP